MSDIEFELEGHEFIELNKLLKITNVVGTGGEANALIENGKIKVNGEVETRKRNKLRAGMVVTFGDVTLKVI